MSELTSYRAYELFNSIKLHFKQSSYSIEKYGYGGKSMSFDIFNKKRDKQIYKKLATIYQLEDRFIDCCAINLFYNPELWIGDLVNDKARERYLKFRAVKTSVSYYVIEDLKRIKNSGKSFSNYFKSDALLQDLISETMYPLTYLCVKKITGNRIVFPKNIIADRLESRLNKLNYFIPSNDIYFYEDLRDNCKNLLCVN